MNPNSEAGFEHTGLKMKTVLILYSLPYGRFQSILFFALVDGLSCSGFRVWEREGRRFYFSRFRPDNERNILVGKTPNPCALSHRAHMFCVIATAIREVKRQQLLIFFSLRVVFFLAFRLLTRHT